MEPAEVRFTAFWQCAGSQCRRALGLLAAVPTTDAIGTAPVVADGHVYVVDGSGVVYCVDTRTLEVAWSFASRGGKANCNNISSPAVVGPYLHFGTVAGWYYVLDRKTGQVVTELDCGGPVFTAPVVVDDRAYFATFGAKVFAVASDGQVRWMWDFVKEVLGFTGDRWYGADWLKHKQGRVTWEDHFCCSRDLSAHGQTVVVPAGGRTLFLEDRGQTGVLAATGLIPDNSGNEYPAAFGQSIGPDGEVYVQWHRRDNTGRVEILHCAMARSRPISSPARRRPSS